MPNKRQRSPSLSPVKKKPANQRSPSLSPVKKKPANQRSPSLSPVKKRAANFLKLLDSRATDTKFRREELKNRYYNYKFTHSKLYATNEAEHISHIFQYNQYNPGVELHKFSIDNTKINITNKI
jgi:hypothetical protein